MTTSQRSIDTQDLNEYVQALKDYRNTGYKQSLSIIQTLKEADLTPTQVNQVLPGAWLSTVQKIDPQDEDEQKLKNQIVEFLEGLNKRFRDQINNNLSKMKEQSKEKVLTKKSSDSEKENVSQNKMNISEQQSNLKQKAEEPKYSPMSDEIKNFTVQTFATELVTDYKTDPAAKKDMKPIAVEKAKQLEEAVEARVEGDEDKFRIEARNVSSYLATKHNEPLRQGFLSGQIDPKEFLENKEEFLGDELKSKLHEKDKDAFNDGNLNRDVEIVQESELYKCEKCGSRKIEKTEKQMKPASHTSNTILYCAECEHVEMKDDTE